MVALPQEPRPCFRTGALPLHGIAQLVLLILLVFAFMAFADADAEARHFVTTANKILPKKKNFSTRPVVQRTTKAKTSNRAAGVRKKYSVKQQFFPDLSSLRAEYRLHVRSELEKYIGIPYKWGGTGRDGFDCSGFSCTIYLELFGIDLPHNARQQFYSAQLTKCSVQTLSIGDLVFFAPPGRKNRVNHVGIYLDNGRFIHASSMRGITISSIEQTYWRRRLVSAKSLVCKKPVVRQAMLQWKRGGEAPHGGAAAGSRF